MDIFTDPDSDTLQERTRRYMRERFNEQHADARARDRDGAPITLMRGWRPWCDGYGATCADCGKDHPCDC